jgi:hypothetical protein
MLEGKEGAFESGGQQKESGFARRSSAKDGFLVNICGTRRRNTYTTIGIDSVSSHADERGITSKSEGHYWSRLRKLRAAKGWP